ncbi:MAG TPA: glycosyltransferase family 1 protein [Jatrophihabitantaceae bacterium]|jgi:glycosyltransferase involved in cell wall biosynthesis|nr:glycosyltransferase family 1 protein [Jatrophihabitantaceae bacterium]
MQIIVDDQVFTFQRYGGVSRYFAELVSQYRQSPELGVEVHTPFRYVLNEYLLRSDPVRYRHAPLPARIQRGRVLRGLNTKRESLRSLASGRPAPGIVHHTFYFTPALAQPARARLCTVYDMIPELFPELFPGIAPHAAKDEYVQACQALLCISHTTKADLLRHYGSLDKPVVVTPLGVTGNFFAAPPVDVSESPYLLFVGQRGAYKNFEVLLRAFARLRDSSPRLRLVCVGGTPFDETELSRIAELDATGRVSRIGMDDGNLPSMYAGAVAFVFPSRYEGFGLPIVEAFAAGCPVVLADTPCSVEVGGESAQFFPADDDERLAEILAPLVGDLGQQGSRAGWIERGRLRARDYTWRRTAELTRDVYRDLDLRYPA